MKKGHVYLVGAGPGDPGLITVKGLEAIREADVILYDRLANPKLLGHAPQGCELIYCGKLPDRHVLRQEAINSLLVEKALNGQTVVRLKGGDPGMFGRVGEEAAALVEHGIGYTLVPGITSGMAAPLYAGIPATHREYGESFAMVTAHDKSANGQPNLNWQSLIGIDTIAFYMGIANLPYICKNLIQFGKPRKTPVILIRWGTFGRQETLEGTLDTIAEKASAASFTNPAITLVGDVVSLRKRLGWFEGKPLFGRQILLARTGSGKSRIASELTKQGADVIEFPRWIQKEEKADLSILASLSSYEEILFICPESAEAFFNQLANHSIDVRSIKADLYGGSEKSIAVLKSRGLIARHASLLNKKAKKRLVVGEKNAGKGGFEGDFYAAASKRLDSSFLPVLEMMLAEADINTVIFPSAASVSVLMEGEWADKLPQNMLNQAEIACLGEKTAAALQEAGIQADTIPAKASVADLIVSLIGKLPGKEKKDGLSDFS